MKTIAITQARYGSSRLPGKVLLKINGITLLEIHLKRILKSKLIDKLIVATTNEPQSEEIIAIANKCNVNTFQGDLQNVLDRFYQAALPEQPDYIVRLTSDCPLIDAHLIDDVIKYTIDHQLDYCSNTLEPTFPDGEDIEVFKFEALKKAWTNATQPYQKEHVTPYIWENSSFKNGNLFKSANFASNVNYENVRLTVDESADFLVIEKIINELGIDNTWEVYTTFYIASEKINRLNNFIQRNEGSQKK